MRPHYINRGFTVLELLLSFSVIIILGVLAVPVSQSFLVNSRLATSATTLAGLLRRAQFAAQAMDGDSPWGVRIDSGTMTLFKGASYAGRDAAADETIVLSAVVTPSGAPEIVFNKFTGDVNQPDAIVLTTTTNHTSTISVNEKGLVTY